MDPDKRKYIYIYLGIFLFFCVTGLIIGLLLKKSCPNDNFKDNGKCDTCKNNNFTGNTCTYCKPGYVGEFCCPNDNFEDATCSTCKPGFKGTKCNLKEHKCGDGNPCFPTGTQVTNYKPDVTNISDPVDSDTLYNEVADYLENNKDVAKYWVQSMNNDDLRNKLGYVFGNTELEPDPYDGSPWASYELVN